MPNLHTLDLLSCDEALTLPGLLQRRIEKTPDAVAYRQFDAERQAWKSYTWREVGALAGRWQQALAQENLAPGERVAVCLSNSVAWVCFDQAALSLGLVVVPLYPTDSPGNIAYILGDCGAKLLLDGGEQWALLEPLREKFPALQRVLCLDGEQEASAESGIAVSSVANWLPKQAESFRNQVSDPQALASIVYTSGTTGRPKGVMLTHRNMLWDAQAVLQAVPGYREDVYLSFLPLSHTFERTVGYYLPIMAGSCVAFARSTQQLREDLLIIRPTNLIAVPRIFERIHAGLQRQLQERGPLARWLFNCTVDIGWRRFEAEQGRGKPPGSLQQLLWPLLKRLVADKVLARLGGQLRIAVSGGAPLSQPVSRCLVGLGLPLVQGYGLTEAAPVVCANRQINNIPTSVGEPLPGVEIRIGDNAELLVRSPSVMRGYWNRPQDTANVLDTEGWLRTGDQARVADGHVFIQGRLKEILITSTGEKIAPVDMEMALCQDPLFEQALVVGEGKPYLAALVVLEYAAWQLFAASLSLNPSDPAALQSSQMQRALLDRANRWLEDFPGHARIRALYPTLQPWTVEDDLLTPTLKLKRAQIENVYAEQIRMIFNKRPI